MRTSTLFDCVFVIISVLECLIKSKPSILVGTSFQSDKPTTQLDIASTYLLILSTSLKWLIIMF